jgi:hypothetical protein
MLFADLHGRQRDGLPSRRVKGLGVMAIGPALRLWAPAVVVKGP